LFLLGSLICGVAPNSISLIVGRAIAGLGSAGILTGSFIVVAHAVPLHQRPLLTGVVGLMYVAFTLFQKVNEEEILTSCLGSE
jgi:MFS family permease